MSVPSATKLPTEEPVSGFWEGTFGVFPCAHGSGDRGGRATVYRPFGPGTGRCPVAERISGLVAHGPDDSPSRAVGPLPGITREGTQPDPNPSGETGAVSSLLNAEDAGYKVRFAILMHCKIPEMKAEAREDAGANQDLMELTGVLNVASEGPHELFFLHRTPRQKWVGPGAEQITGRTPLHCVVIAGMTDMVKPLILKRRADLNAKDDKGYTPLHYAADQDGTGMVALLVKEQGIKLNLKNHEKQTPLHLAVRSGRIDIVVLLIGQERIKLNRRDHEGRAPLHLAVLSGRIDVVMVLIGQERIKLNQRDHEGNTALHLAVLSNQIGMVALLSACKGVELNLGDNEGSTPLHFAIATESRIDIAKALIANPEVNPCVREHKTKFTPLHLAAAGGPIDVVRWLVARKEVDPNLKSPHEVTPLHLAAAGGRTDVVQLLIKQGAEINSEDGDRCTPLHTAADHGRVDVVRWLINQPGVDPNAEAVCGHTPLHLAARRGHMDVVRVLVDRGVELNPVCDGMKTPVDCARMGGHPDVADFLVGQGGTDALSDVMRLLQVRMGRFANRR
ncbi:MAG: ankyrin repeat domain-containing protein [Simkaniaceae bacterium]|nr:ankyrin repeat domain-containing protein [Simkaniaceae bacterium]